ncbi:HAD-IA family hydrolase [Nocardioidaceae bacterium]|nr:HAD-IA family hydrolase [Nocardioidaceae bacterium]
MTAVLFGSISTIADTSEMQRHAFNDAFAEHGLDWSWDQDEYRRMLTSNGGRDRIAAYAEDRGESVDADAVHATKSRLFQQALAGTDLEPRSGVVRTVREAREGNHQVALVTTTSPENVEALLTAVSAHLDRDSFDLVLDRETVDGEGKPDPAAYTQALERLGAGSSDAVAVEDNAGGVSAAVAAGIVCAAFPNQNTADHQFPGASSVLDHLDLHALRGLTQS